MNMNDIRLLLLLVLFPSFGYAGEPVAATKDLVEVARTLKLHETGEGKKKRLEKIKTKLKSTEVQSMRFAQLLDGFVSLNVEGNLKKAEEAMAVLVHEKEIAEWEQYCIRVLQASIEGKQGKRLEARRSIDWLCENLPILERGKKTNKLCAALIEGLEKGKGPFEAGLQLSKAGNLVETGREKEAKVIFQAVMDNFPKTGWATSARNRLNHLKNKKAVAEIMAKKYQPERARK